MKQLFIFNNNEYVSGWQYFFRHLLGVALSAGIIGLYILAVNAYKRAKSLGYGRRSCIAWSIWGCISFPFAAVDIPHLYLWWSNGRRKKEKSNDKIGKQFISNEIIELKKLLDSGALSKEEFELAKKKVLK